MREPTTTSYALLGLLAIRPWTGYELTQQAKRSLHYAWPRSEANLYSQQKRLVNLGWAHVDKEQVGRRTRNLYSITPAGRDALRAWLETEPETLQLDIEGLLRLFFADHGSIEDVVAALHTTADRAGADLDRMLGFVADYLDTGGPFPQRLHLIALAVELVTDLLDRIETFSHDAAAEISTWETTAQRGMTDDTRRRLERVLSRHADHTAQQRRTP